MMKTGKPSPTKMIATRLSARLKGKRIPVTTPPRNTPRRPSK